MSNIIKTVSYESGNSKTFLEKLKEHLGIQKLAIVLKDGETLEGILSELGQDYVSLLAKEAELIIPVSNIKYLRYQN